MRSLLFISLFFVSILSYSQTPDKQRGKEQVYPANPNAGTSTDPKVGNASSTTDITWEPLVEMDGNLFTSYIYAAAFMPNRAADHDEYKGDKNGQIGIRIKPTAANTKIKLTVDAPEIMYTSYIEEDLKEVKEYEIFPVIKYKFEELLKIKQNKIVSITFKLNVNGKDMPEKPKITPVKSINECLIAYVHRNDPNAYSVTKWMVAAYVNEGNPLLQDEVLPIVKKTNIIDQMTGYLTYSDDNTGRCTEDVFKQVFAVWAALQERGVTYSNITGSGDNPHVMSQYIRFTDDAWKSNQANCVDGTALFASILYKMGIDPVMVLVPGHCFLGFYDRPRLDSQGKAIENRESNLFFLETTMIGSKTVNDSLISARLMDAFDAMLTPETKAKYDFAKRSFLAALIVGAREANQYKAYFGDPSKHCNMIDVDQARKEGVAAIPAR
jgi:hypothetical protein